MYLWFLLYLQICLGLQADSFFCAHTFYLWTYNGLYKTRYSFCIFIIWHLTCGVNMCHNYLQKRKNPYRNIVTDEAGSEIDPLQPGCLYVCTERKSLCLVSFKLGVTEKLKRQ